MISADTTIKEMCRLGLMSVRAMNVCRSGEIKTLAQLLNTESAELLRIRGCGRKALMELTIIREYYSLNLQENGVCETVEEHIEESIEVIEATKKVELLAPDSVEHLKGWIARKFNQLSVRAKNAFPQFNQLLSVIDTIYSTKKFNAQNAKNIGKKTAGEIQSFLSEVKAHFEVITQGIDPNAEVTAHNETDWLVAQLGVLYPFLLTKECEMVAKHTSSHGFVPILFIAKQYILRSEDLRMNIYRDYYGFNSEMKRYSLSDIGAKNNLSRERIRQIVSNKIPLPNIIDDEIGRYLTPLLENIIALDSLFWNKVQRDNMLEELYSQTALLAYSLTDTHTIIQIEDNDNEYLVNKELIENVKIRSVLNKIVRVIALRRTTVERLDILDYIKEENREYHKDVSQLCCIYANYLRKNYDVDIEDDRYVMMLPTAMDVSAAIEDILEQSGEPMSLEDIKQAFNALYPSNPIDDAAKLKPYIFKNPNIKPKGKTGIYILKSWKNHFTGTLTSYLEHILHTFNEPISLDDLVDFAHEEFPNTNKKSVYSLIASDKNHRFVMYEDEKIGLCNKMIADNPLNLRRIIKRYSFEKRFESIMQYVEIHKRLPLQVGLEEEKSLARWIENIQKSNIDSTEEQKRLLQEFLYENRTIPSSGLEYRFKQMCDRIKVIVTQTFSLPIPKTNDEEYHWLKRNKERYVFYKDNRKVYFEDLLDYLRDFGFYL